MRAIIGPNGAGKTTMMDIITGKTKPDAGEVFFDHGKVDLTKHDEADIATMGIGRKFQKPTVFESQSVEDNITAGDEGKARRGVFAVPPLDTVRDKTHQLKFSTRCASPPSAISSPPICRMGRSNGSKSACCLAQDPMLLLGR